VQEINEVDAYIQALPPDRSAALTALRNLVRETLPEARETMRYRMPTYELDEVVCSFASQKHYMSLYLDSGLVEENRKQWGKTGRRQELCTFQTSGGFTAAGRVPNPRPDHRETVKFLIEACFRRRHTDTSL